MSGEFSPEKCDITDAVGWWMHKTNELSERENISTLVVESVLATHPDILEVAVVTVPEDKWGERDKAYATTEKERPSAGDNVVKWAKKPRGISPFMVPGEVRILPELPKKSTREIQKYISSSWAEC